MIASSASLPLTAPTAIARATPASIPVKTPIPPRAGVSRVCQRLLEAASCARANGARSAIQITVAHTGNAIAETSALIEQVLHLESVRMSVYAEILQHRELFANLFRRDFRAKYKGTFLGGVLWSLVNPLVLMGIYTLVFSGALSGLGKSRTIRSTFFGLAIWAFLSAALGRRRARCWTTRT